jgi:hypothetical protein
MTRLGLSSTALGEGTHQIAVHESAPKALGKQAGDEVTVRLQERLG